MRGLKRRGDIMPFDGGPPRRSLQRAADSTRSRQVCQFVAKPGRPFRQISVSETLSVAMICSEEFNDEQSHTQGIYYLLMPATNIDVQNYQVEVKVILGVRCLCAPIPHLFFASPVAKPKPSSRRLR